MTADTGRNDHTTAIGDDSDDDDDAALNWGPSSDRSYVEGPSSGLADASPAASDDDEEDDLPDGVMSSGLLVAHGVFAAILLLYTVAWLKSIGGVQPSFDASVSGHVAAAMWKIGTWLSVAAPAIWFVVTVYLVPTIRPRARVVSLLVAVLVLFPWPFVITGVA